MNVTKNRHQYLDLIRVVSCVLIICTHVSAVDFSTFPVNSLNWNILNIFNCIGINGVPLFFMISGALILHKDYQISLKKLWIQKIGRLLAAYYVTLFFYNLLPFLKGYVPFQWEIIKEDLIEAVLYEKGIYHLWFLPVLVVLYFLAPILKEAFQTKKICAYYLILFAVIGALLPTLLFFDLPGPIRRFVTHYQGKASLFMVVGYIGYFVLGHYLHSYLEELSGRKVLFIWLTTGAALLFTILTGGYFSLKQGSPSSLTNTPLSLNVLISSSGIYILFKHYCSRIHFSKGFDLIKKLSKYTFGIYLFHPFVLGNIPLITNLGQWLPGSFFLTILQVALTGFLTFVIVAVIKKIPLLTKIF